MLTVHHLENSRSQRILWLLEELAVPYQIVCYQRDPKTMLAPAALRAVHPLGKSPLVSLEDGSVLAESGAIVETLIAEFGVDQLAPAPASSAYQRYRYWLHYAEGSAMPPLLLKLVFDRMATTPVPFFIRPVVKAIAAKAQSGFVAPQLKLHLDYLEAELGKSTWFAGETFSGADIQMSFPIEAAAARAGLNASRPRLMAFLQRIHDRPAYQRALERGGAYAFGPDSGK